MELYALKTLHSTEPLGIDQTPYFSWKLKSGEQNTMQTAYQIRVCEEDGALFWDSGRRESEADSFVSYEGKPLLSRSLYHWTVTVWDNHGNETSATSSFETALLQKGDWQARWAASPLPQVKRKKGYGKQAPATYFRKCFTIGK